ncbi:peroxiredoxin (alkyl hydroperoxide reductase subunit C) [Draconibacterium orientale]|jgi:peroxiredoxin (alkyl hydroperoxide reductase subunit C)|uniref:Alkyl hydroperoxide reductase C n=2 Tax=Draconibacterium orientale TaxID=1168034 RepID=X5DF58_9BACT|nr:peroxiredoxin [Draconibacterium orientale]AHW59012.1 peroxiredoxin [Draconibacterium orientale]SET92012.1 peroxiredoxin (alkyl hydroperoxide reductase subunit C) [Draconibacterium orientale]
MACVNGVKPLKKKKNKENVVENLKTEEKSMSATMVRQLMPEFEMEAYDAKTGHYKTVKSEDYKDKWTVVCFYPADFTFVCPTEIAAMNAHYDEFQELGVELLPVSVDSKFSHKRFVETEPILKGLQLTIGADTTQEVSRAFGVLIEEEGVALRGRFLFNPDGVCVAQEVQADSVGRNVIEFIRQIKAWQHASKTGEVCPAGWRPGKKTLPVNTDVEKMTGKVGDYITLEEILS